jgi:hypothetical protein
VYNYDLAVIAAVLVFTLAIIFIVLYFYLSIITRTLKRISNQFSVYFGDMIKGSKNRHRFLYQDQFNIERQLVFSRLKFKGRPLTYRKFILLSFLTGLAGIALAYLTTARFSSVNSPAYVITALGGFIIPRWYLIVLDGRIQRKIASEVPRALAKITDFARNYANMERAVMEATSELPATTRRFFQQAWEWRRVGYYQTFPEMMYDVGRKTKNATWLDFAHMCLIDVTLGNSDKISKLRSIQNRSRQILIASKIERRSLNGKFLKVIIAYCFLFIIWFAETFIFPDIGIFLYTTPIGRLLIDSVYITFTFNVALFTWLYFDN